MPYRLGLVGDLGQTENSAQTLEHLMANGPASVLNVGDLSYAGERNDTRLTYCLVPA